MAANANALEQADCERGGYLCYEIRSGGQAQSKRGEGGRDIADILIGDGASFRMLATLALLHYVARCTASPHGQRCHSSSSVTCVF